MEEREISLTDLIFDLLLRWRMFLLWAVIGVVLFSGFSYVKSWRQAKAEEAAVAEAQRQLDEQESEQSEQGNTLEEVGSGERADADPELLEEAASLLDEKQLANVEYVLECEKWYQQRLDYLENSPLFQIDAGDVKKATVTAWIDASSEEQALAVKIAYENAIRNGEAAQFASDQLDIPAPYLTELISLYTRTQNSLAAQDDHCVTIVLTYPDEQGCEELAQAIAQYLESKKSDFATVGGSYSLKVLQQDVCSVSDQVIIDKQQGYYNGAIAMQTEILEKKAAFSEYELQYYDICTNGKITSLSEQVAEGSGEEESDGEEKTAAENPKAIVEKGVTTVPGISLKYALLGFLLMAMAYAVYACFAYSFHARVQENDDFMQLFGIPQLGQIPAQQGKKKFLGFVDAWILSLRDKNKRKFSKEEAIQLSSVAVKMAAARNDADEVSLVCSGFKEDALAVCGVIKDDLAKENTKASILNNVLYDAAVMEDLEDSKAAVLVAKAGSTLYDELAQELELLKRQEIPVLGGIVIG